MNMNIIPRAEHPRPDYARKNWLNLNGEWDFAFGGKDECPGLDKTIVVPYSWAAPLSGVAEDVKGTGWYRRTARFNVQGDVWLVSAGWMERLIADINFDDYESRNYFDLQLRKCGLFAKLEEMGIEDGDVVDIYDLEFEYQR